MNKLKVGLLGKRGLVGQAYEKLLKDHPYFELTFAPLREELENTKRAKDCALVFSGADFISISYGHCDLFTRRQFCNGGNNSFKPISRALEVGAWVYSYSR